METMAVMGLVVLLKSDKQVTGIFTRHFSGSLQVIATASLTSNILLKRYLYAPISNILLRRYLYAPISNILLRRYLYAPITIMHHQ